MAGTNGAEIGFEKEIRDAVCVLRGNMDAAGYKHVVLGLIFLMTGELSGLFAQSRIPEKEIRNRLGGR
ncbi:MAG: type I restriction-modification system subunit M N-terminal domain-containing protein [Spirochaetaceae bacterium]|nr:type I restriction-modification system subunit M N-terminal domain-containing protein [Spirochaetaceae bacterium]